MKRFFILLILYSGITQASQIPIYYDFSEQAEQAFTIDNFRFHLPDDYKNIFLADGSEPPNYNSMVASKVRSLIDTNSFPVTTNTLESIALGHYDFRDHNNATNYLEQLGIESSFLQLQDLEIIDNQLTYIAPYAYYGGPDEFKNLATNDLFVINGVIVKSFFHNGGYAYGEAFNNNGGSIPFSGVFFLALDNNKLHTFWSDYESSLKYIDSTFDEYEVMTMYKRIYSSNPITKYIGVTNYYEFSQNNPTWEFNFSNSSNQFSNLNNQIDTLQTQVDNLVSYTNNQTDANAQLKIINNIVNVYQSQINTLEEELETVYEYTNRMTITEAQTAMRDLRVGSQTFGVSNGNATIRMYVDESLRSN